MNTHLLSSGKQPAVIDNTHSMDFRPPGSGNPEALQRWEEENCAREAQPCQSWTYVVTTQREEEDGKSQEDCTWRSGECEL